MRVILAPMEGVLDPLIRQLLSEINEYDHCVTEFIRVVNSKLPVKTFHKLCPELLNNGSTLSGTPVRIQLLGSSESWLAENAHRAIELGSFGIDFNCGCPSKTVNNSEGGAALLKDPEQIYRCTRAIRAAVSSHHPISVKVRLGWDSDENKFEIADAVQQANASEITIHGRTKNEGYRADKINWSAIGEIKQRLAIPVVANGEIWNYTDALTCLASSHCDALMVGRGALSLPNLSQVIKKEAAHLPWIKALKLLYHYVNMEKHNDNGFYHLARIKQWLGYLRKEYPEAALLFAEVRAATTADSLRQQITQAYFKQL